MFRKTTIKKSVILLVALLMCAVVVFTACNSSKAFKEVSYDNDKQVDGNGGVAVRYGDYIYYVNGYQSSAASKNSYADEVRIGSIVRVKIADLESIIRLNGDDSEKISEKIAEQVAQKVELVVPNFYYNGNTADPSMNGLFIFNNRLYITTPNNELDASGNMLNTQLVLVSYNLGGGDMQRHFVFKSGLNPQLKLSQVGENLYATYIMDSNLYMFKVGAGMATATTIAEKISSVKFSSDYDANGNVIADYVYYLDSDGAVCQYKVGTERPNAEERVDTVLAKVEAEEGHEGHSHSASLSIVAVNGSNVYYTNSTEKALYRAAKDVEGAPILGVVPTTYFGWGDKVVYTASENVEDTTIYHIYVSSGDGSVKRDVVDPTQNGNAITLNKLQGNVLYYATNSISYKLDLSDENATPVAYAYNLSTSATGWAVPDVLSFEWKNGSKTENISYVFTVTSTGVSVLKFNDKRNNNYLEGTKDKSSSTTITLKAE